MKGTSYGPSVVYCDVKPLNMFDPRRQTRSCVFSSGSDSPVASAAILAPAVFTGSSHVFQILPQTETALQR